MTGSDESLRRRHRRLLNAAAAVIESAAPGDDDQATVPVSALQTLQRELAEDEPVPYSTMSVT
jgi:hypothetical protein